MIITIDGPSGAGKSTAARGLAQRLGYEYLDTGAMYRAAAVLLTRAGIDFKDVGPVVEFLNRTQLEMPPGKVIVDGEDLSDAIRTLRASDAASRVAAEAHVRAILVGWQRLVARGRDMVCEGRDQGTVVFVESPCKFFLTATIGTRAARRFAELEEKGIATTMEEVAEDIRIRDHRDRTRAVGPLLQPKDAIVINADGLSPEQVLDRLEQGVAQCRCLLG